MQKITNVNGTPSTVKTSANKERDNTMDQQTYFIETDKGITYLIIDEGDDLHEQWNLYKNDEVGEEFKNAKNFKR